MNERTRLRNLYWNMMSRCHDPNHKSLRALQEAVIELQEELEVSRDKSAKLQKLLNEAREPSGHRHEEVAEWLRGRGYKVEAPMAEGKEAER